MPRSYGVHTRMLVKPESVYGTAPAGDYEQAPFISSSLGAEQGMEQAPEVGMGRDPIDPIRGPVEEGGDIVVPVDVRNTGRWLEALLGTSAVAGVGPYTHSWTSGAETLPSLAIEIGHTRIPRYFMNTGLLVGAARFEFRRAGAARMTLEIAGQNETGAATSQGGTPTVRAFRRFNQFQGFIERDGVALANVVSADFSYQNGLDRVEVIRSDGLVDGIDPTIAACSGQIVARFADMTLHDAATSDTPLALGFGYEIDADNRLAFTLHRVKLERTKKPIEGPGGIEETIRFIAATDDVAGQMLTATLVNDVASYA